MSGIASNCAAASSPERAKTVASSPLICSPLSSICSGTAAAIFSNSGRSSSNSCADRASMAGL